MMLHLDDRFGWLKSFTTDVIRDPHSGITAEDIVSSVVGRPVRLDPGADTDTFAARFGDKAASVRVVLEVVAAHRPTPSAPPWPHASAAPRGTPAAAPRRRKPPADATLLCAVSRRLPKHAMLGADGRLYDRDRIAGLPIATQAVSDHTMTGVINAWREHRRDPERCAEALRTAVQCPILLEVPEDPVIAADGFTYERTALSEHLRNAGEEARSPVTNAALPHQRLRPGESVARVIAAHGLLDEDATLSCPQAVYTYVGPARTGIRAILPDGPHRALLTNAHRELQEMYAWHANKVPAAARDVAVRRTLGHLNNVLAWAPAPQLRRVALQLRVEVCCLAELWTRALKDLDVLGETMDAFERLRRAMALQALGRHDEADSCMRQAGRRGLLRELGGLPSGPCELLAVVGEALRHRHRYAAAEQVLRHAYAQGPSAFAERALAKTRRSMLWRFVRSTPLSRDALDAALIR